MGEQPTCITRLRPTHLSSRSSCRTSTQPPLAQHAQGSTAANKSSPRLRHCPPPWSGTSMSVTGPLDFRWTSARSLGLRTPPVIATCLKCMLILPRPPTLATCSLFLQWVESCATMPRSRPPSTEPYGLRAASPLQLLLHSLTARTPQSPKPRPAEVGLGSHFVSKPPSNVIESVVTTSV